MEEGRWGRLLQQLRESCELAGIKTEEVARLSRRRLDALSIDREIAKQQAAIGRRVCELAGQAQPGDPFADEIVQKLILRVRELEAGRAQFRTEIEEIQETARGKTGEVKQRYERERQGEGERAPDGKEHEPVPARPVATDPLPAEQMVAPSHGGSPREEASLDWDPSSDLPRSEDS